MDENDPGTTGSPDLDLVAEFRMRIEKLIWSWEEQDRLAQRRATPDSCGDSEEKKAEWQANWAAEVEHAQHREWSSLLDVVNTVEPIIAICNKRAVYPGSLSRYLGEPVILDRPRLREDRRVLDRLADVLRHQLDISSALVGGRGAVAAATPTEEGDRPGTAGGRKTRTKNATALRSWTQPELDRAIAEYVASGGRAAQYKSLGDVLADPKTSMKAIRAARKAARETFGRNTIVRALGVRSPSMVSKSAEWEKIARTFGFPLRRDKAKGTRHTRTTGRIGLDMAIEEASAVLKVGTDGTAPDVALEQQEQQETFRQIQQLVDSARNDQERSARTEMARKLFSKYEDGTMTDEQVRKKVAAILKTAK